MWLMEVLAAVLLIVVEGCLLITQTDNTQNEYRFGGNAKEPDVYIATSP